MNHHFDPEAKTLFLSNSAINTYTACPRLYKLTWEDSFTSLDDSSALVLGSAIHFALRVRYRQKAWTPELELRQLYALHLFWKKRPTAVGDYRSLSFAKQAIRDYNQAWKDEHVQPASLAQVHQVVEEPFVVYLGNVGSIRCYLRGRIDLVTEEPNNTLLFTDHKTSSVGGDLLLPQLYASSQFKAYAYVLSKLAPGKTIAGQANILILRKPAKTKGLGNEFLRQPIPTSQWAIDEWHHNTMEICRNILLCYHGHSWPAHTSQCLHRFGKCDMYDICSIPVEQRLPQLLGPGYKKQEWPDLQPDPVPLSEVESATLEEMEKVVGASEPTAPSLDDLTLSFYGKTD